MHENLKLPLTRLKKKIELGTIGIDQYEYAYDRVKLGACIKNRRTIQELCRRTIILHQLIRSCLHLLQKQYQGVFVQNVYKYGKCSLNFKL